MLRTRLASSLVLLGTLFSITQPLSASPAAVTYYVSSSSGNDNNTGLSAGSAFATIAKVNALNLQLGG